MKGQKSGVGNIEARNNKMQLVACLMRAYLSCLSPGFWLLVCLPLMGGCSWFFEADKREGEEKATLDLPSIPYQTIIKPKVVEDSTPEIEAHLKAVSSLIKLESRPPTSLNALYHRIRNDVARLKQALAEKGYFDGEVEFSLAEGVAPVIVTLTFTMGERYKVSGISVVATENARERLPLTPSRAAREVRFHVGDDVDLSRIQEANQRLAKYLRNHGYPYGDMAEPEGQIDREAKRINVIFRAKPGQYATFGKADITGLKDLPSQFVRNRLVWQEGERFDERRLEITRHKLMGTGLFSAIDIRPDENAPASGVVPLSVKVTEGPPRTIGTGLKYATTEGIGGQTFWSHRNVFGSGECLGAMLRISPRLSRAKVDFSIPDIFAPEQYLRHEISATREQNRAFTSRSLDAGIRLEHPFTDTLKGMVGVTGETGRVKRAEVEYINRLIGFPVDMHIDASNSLIEPTRGGRLTAQVTPYVGRSGKDTRLMVSTAKGSYYLRVLQSDAIVIAGWAHGGTITVSSLNNLAPDKRFYAGGAGSVRAYGYKLLGPLDKDRVPLGGRSIVEYGVEGRFKVTDTIGFVLFAEAGKLSSKASPDLSSQAQLWGVGAGVRYYTGIGPIRFDIATPMKRRKDGLPKPIDAAYQFYLSAGQAF
ncbi:MAG: ytfM [Alphaproteobacteria bacterium]|nr:ytfM [Alphaproteobacteria bacterium]